MPFDTILESSFFNILLCIHQLAREVKDGYFNIFIIFCTFNGKLPGVSPHVEDLSGFIFENYGHHLRERGIGVIMVEAKPAFTKLIRHLCQCFIYRRPVTKNIDIGKAGEYTPVVDPLCPSGWKMSLVGKVLDTVRVHFISGILVVVPIILTYIVLKFLFEIICVSGNQKRLLSVN